MNVTADFCFRETLRHQGILLFEFQRITYEGTKNSFLLKQNFAITEFVTSGIHRIFPDGLTARMVAAAEGIRFP